MGADEAIHAVLASFPRSGRTWLAGMISAAELRDLRKDAPGPIRAFVNSMSSDVVDEWRSAFGDLQRPPLRLATHEKYDGRAHPERVVALVRSPADALWSYYHYRTAHQQSYAGSLDSFLGEAGLGIPALARWYNSWVETRDTAVVIEYEKLRADPGTHLRRALDGLDCTTTVDTDVIAERWEFSRRQENELKTSNESTTPNALFIRSGVIGEGRESFTGAQMERLESDLHRLLSADAISWMRSLGYLAS